MIQRDFFDDGTEVETRQVTVTSVRKTYGQNWSAYNAAQTSEKSLSQSLLYDLCQGIVEPTEVRTGRPRMPIRDGIFCACFKVYSQLSSRRFISDLCDSHAKGYISRVPHFNPILRVFDSEETTAILADLVARAPHRWRQSNQTSRWIAAAFPVAALTAGTTPSGAATWNSVCPALGSRPTQ